jgi:LasA protease
MFTWDCERLSRVKDCSLLPYRQAIFQYRAQSGDTLPALALRFRRRAPDQITSAIDPIPAYTLIAPGQLLTIPNVLWGCRILPWALLPDSEIVYSPSAADFDIAAYIAQAGGFLSTYSEMIDGEWHTAAQSIERAALETSTNPRILLSALEYQSGWVRGGPRSTTPAIQWVLWSQNMKAVYKQLILTQRQLTIGYYGWRTGSFTQLPLGIPVHPELNAGSVAVQHLFGVLYKEDNWRQALYGPNNFIQLHIEMFGDPWARAAQVEPLLPAGSAQPALELPFRPGEPWNLTGGPHASWGIGSAQGGLDFAPRARCAAAPTLMLGQLLLRQAWYSLWSRNSSARPGRRRPRTNRLVPDVPACRHEWTRSLRRSIQC